VAVVVSVYPGECRHLDSLAGLPWCAPVDQFGFEKAVDGFCERVVIAVADAANLWLTAGFGQALGVFDCDVLGGFNWSSQHSGGMLDGGSTSIGSCVAGKAEFVGATSRCATGAPAAFLGVDCRRAIQRGRGDWRGCVSTGRSTLVPKGRRHATIDNSTIIEAVVRAMFVVRGAGGACDPACAGSRGAADCPAHGAVGVTISRELRRNAATRSGELDYRATTAQWHADRAARRPKPAKMAVNLALRTYVQDRLAGSGGPTSTKL
jgi:hypothetical protein